MVVPSMPRRFAVLAAAVGLVASSAISVAAAEPQKAPGPSPKFTSAAAFDVSPALSSLAGSATRRAAPADPGAEPVEIRRTAGRSFRIRALRRRCPAGAPLRAWWRPRPPRRSRLRSPTSRASATRTTSTSSASVSTRPTRSAMSARTTTSKWSTWRSPSTTSRATCCSDRSTPAPVGRLRRRGLHRPVRRPDRALRPVADRWLLSQFTTRGPMYYNCVAISTTGDPTGAYYRYAFVTQPDPELPGGTFFPDYPKYGVWTDSYIMTTRDFGDVDRVRDQRLRPRKEQDDRGQPEGPRRAVLPRLERRPARADGRRPAAARHRRQADADRRRRRPDRGHPGRRRPATAPPSTPSTSGI